MVQLTTGFGKSAEILRGVNIALLGRESFNSTLVFVSEILISQTPGGIFPFLSAGADFMVIPDEGDITLTILLSQSSWYKSALPALGSFLPNTG